MIAAIAMEKCLWLNTCHNYNIYVKFFNSFFGYMKESKLFKLEDTFQEL